MGARKKRNPTRREFPDWMYAYPDGRNAVISRLLLLMSRIDFGTPTTRGIVPCRVKLEDAVAIQKEIASVNGSTT